ncbi:facilitated trehalose transporter Tret1 isoform X2 [Anabrus simplex]|uniref:facilitated trehalose transporter Tret1 isoform X2 n=1 Tax=Anabrus simplex TaxID=316456 RepID=UPI0035A35574
MTTSREDTKSLVICDDAGYTKIGHSKTRQHVAAILANLATLCIGMANAWTAPALPLIQRQTDVILPLYATEEQASWISSLLPIGAVVGALPAGYLADKLGRRRVLLMMALPFFLGWMLIVLAADSILQVYAGRFIIGLAAGACTVLVPIYNEEIAEDSIRGMIGVYFNLMLFSGILLMYLLGAFLSYIHFTVAGCLMPILFFKIFFWMPESPTYLVFTKRLPEAEKSLMWLRDSSILYDVGVQPEILTLMTRATENATSSSTLCTRTSLKAIAIIFGLVLFQQLSGINALIYYAVEIFNDAGSSVSGYISSIIIGAVQILAVSIPCFTVDRFGRKPLLIISSILVAICLGLISGYFYFKDHNYDIDSWRWIPLTSLVTYVITLTIGFGTLPFFMVAELVPTSIKGKVTSASTSLYWATSFLVTKIFPYMVHNVGQDITYGILSGISVLACIFTIFAVPETKGKSREEIQDILENRFMF